MSYTASGGGVSYTASGPVVPARAYRLSLFLSSSSFLKFYSTF